VPQSSLDEEACRAKNAKIKGSAARRRWRALPCAAGRRGLFDIVSCVYAAPGFVTASVRSRPRSCANKPQMRANARRSALRTDVLQAEVAPVACFRPVFSCYGRQFGASLNGAGRARFPSSSCGLRGDRRRQVVPRLLFFSCILQDNRSIPAAGRHRGCMPFLPRLAPTATTYVL
jgi:hypothetical protein